MRCSLLPPAAVVVAVGAALFGATSVLAGSPPSCSLSNRCPESAPCCSQYGECGVGAYCLGGCDPRMSFSLDSCAPAPVCADRTLAMTSLDGIVDISRYLGDPSTADWVSQGQPAVADGRVLLTMPKDSVGTVLASTVYMWYGTVRARLRTSRGPGVVTAFILFSDVKDEIDFEFVGTELETAQTNYYFQGTPDYTHSTNISLADTFDTLHEYEIRWTPDNVTWLVDGQLGRVLHKADTWNATAQQWAFPQTPARVEFSLWPGGAATNAPGTISWAGGPISWGADAVGSAGYYYASVGEVTMECYRPEGGSRPGTNSGVSYWYADASATNNTVVDGDRPTVLGSFSATGSDMDAGKPSGTGSAGAPSSTSAQIPGGGENPGSSGAGFNPPADGSGPSGSGGGGPGGGADCDSGSFSQTCGSSVNGDGNKSAAATLGPSACTAVVMALGALLTFRSTSRSLF